MSSQSIAAYELEFRPYTAEFVGSVKAFNQRLRDGGEATNYFPESHVPNYPKTSDCELLQERFLLLYRGQVRGGYVLTHQIFCIRGKCELIACGPQLALSEGIVDRRYGMFGVLLIEDAIARQPLMYGLGMAGMDGPLTKLMGEMGWALLSVPFYFKVVRPDRFLANINYLRQQRKQRLAVDFVRHTGLGWLGFNVAQFRFAKRDSSTQSHAFDHFEDWADEIWERSSEEYAMISHRDSKTLNRIYHPSEPRFLRIRVCRDRETLGWVVMLDEQMFGHRRFGNMRVGFIMDCLASRQHAMQVVRAATQYLEKRGVDMIVTNQTNADWKNALKLNGFLHGPSTTTLGLSPELAAKLQPIEVVKEGFHINRGNGHGPILKW